MKLCLQDGAELFCTVDGGVAALFPKGHLVVFPGVCGFVQHILPVPWPAPGLILPVA